MNIITKIKSNIFEIIALVIIFVLLDYIFALDYYSLAIILGSFFSFYTLYRLSTHSIRNNIIISLLVTAISYQYYESPVRIILVILGFNLAGLFIQLRNLEIKTIDLSVANTIGLANILLFSGIEKFRGVNKLNLLDIQMTVPIIVLLTFFLFLITSYLSQYWPYFRKHLVGKFKFVNFLIASIICGVIIFIYYKETGPENILLPFLCGMLVVLIRITIKPATVLNEILEIILLIMFPYQIAGYTGIAISLLSMYLSEYYLNLKLSRIDTSSQLRIAKYSPLLFLFASQEIRENEGLINHLDITNGYQIGWLFISLTIVRFAVSHLNSFKTMLTKNEISKLYPQLIIICAIAIFAIIIRSGRFEGTTAIVTTITAYMFLMTSGDLYKSKGVLRFLNSAAGLIGAMSFIVLTTL